MSKSGADKLSQEKLQQLLAAVGAKSQDDTSQDLDVLEFDWREPRYFNLEQLENVNGFAETAVSECTGDLSRLYHGECRVSLISVRQHFSSTFYDDNESNDYYLPFGVDSQKPFGLMAIPHQSALNWTGLILGAATPGETSDRPLSKLEESFLLDIASGLIAAFSRAYKCALQPGRSIVRDRSTVTLQGSDEVLEITFEAGKADSGAGVAKASFLVCCDKLGSVAGKAASPTEKLTESQIYKTILEHVHQVPVSIHVELGTVMLPFKDIVNLQVDDILVLNKTVSDTVGVLVEDRVLFNGHPVQSGGKHAVFIV